LGDDRSIARQLHLVHITNLVTAEGFANNANTVYVKDGIKAFSGSG
jgi:hypothetical protein